MPNFALSTTLPLLKKSRKTKRVELL